MADRIITVDRGRLIEDGTHDDLIKTGGRYATLYRLQNGTGVRARSARKGARVDRAGLHEVR
jgi:subfamily B ATP-binding cassette protein HlyB/CyaB